MKHFIVKALLNVGEDNFSGYTPKAPLAQVTFPSGKVMDFQFYGDLKDAHQVANLMWAVGNKIGPDSPGVWWPMDVRSLSVGDVITIRENNAPDQLTLAVASLGFDEISEPGNPIVPMEGTHHTSRR